MIRSIFSNIRQQRNNSLIAAAAAASFGSHAVTPSAVLPPLSELTKKFIAIEEKYGAMNYHPMPVVIKSARGCMMTDVDNREYYDMLSAYSAVNQGHLHPKIMQAFREQSERLTLTSRAFFNDTLGEYVKFASEMFGYDRLLPMNSGAEAVETAVKLSRRWAYVVKGVKVDAATVYFLSGNFHGRTMTAITASDDPESHDLFGPYLPNIRTLPLEQLEQALASDPNAAAVVIEPIQGEAGVVMHPDGALRRLRDACTRHNVLLVSDEIQTGLGRTGYMLAVEHDNVRPDIVLLGKALSGGTMAVSAVLADDEVMLTIKAGQHGSTFGGNPIANKVAVASLKALRDEDMCVNAMKRGEQFRAGLSQLPSDVVTGVRGRGLMNAIVIKGEHEDTAWNLCLYMAKHGILAKPTRRDRIRLTPPLIITDKQVDDCLTRIQRACVDFKTHH